MLFLDPRSRAGMTGRDPVNYIKLFNTRKIHLTLFVKMFSGFVGGSAATVIGVVDVGLLALIFSPFTSGIILDTLRVVLTGFLIIIFVVVLTGVDETA